MNNHELTCQNIDRIAKNITKVLLLIDQLEGKTPGSDVLFLVDLKENKDYSNELRFTKYMHTKLTELYPENKILKKAKVEPWTKDVRGMFKTDERDPEKTFDLFNLVIGDEFWQKNILSPSGFRKHYDQLYTKLIQSAKNKKEDETTIKAVKYDNE